MDFSTIEITLKKVRENDADFSISEITSKKYVEMTWKYVEIWSSKYRHNIHIESTSIQRGVPIGDFWVIAQTLYAYREFSQKTYAFSLVL